MKSCRQAFTLLEILLVVVVIGIVATATLPRLLRRKPAAEWNNVLNEINSLVSYARQEAIAQHDTYRLHFRISRQGVHSVHIEIQKDHPEKPGQKIFEKTETSYLEPTYTFPDSITLEGVYHQTKENELEEHNQHAYCHIVPNGLVQETMIHLLKRADGKEQKRTLKMQPFFGRFGIEEGFEKPKRRR